MNHDGVERILKARLDAPCLLDKMTQQIETTDGKRLFKELVNHSDTGNMYEVETDREKMLEYLKSSKREQFKDFSKVEYQMPAVKKVFKRRDSVIHNAIANKFKRNDEHLEETMKVSNPGKVALIKALHNNNIGFTLITSLKNGLFESDKL